MKTWLLSRTRLLTWLMVAIGAIFIARLFYLQIVQHDYYEAEAEQEHTAKFTLAARRGLIYTRNGDQPIVPLVLNETVYTVYADPRYVQDVHKTADALRHIAGGNLVGNIEESLADTSHQYVVLARQLSNEQADLLKKQDLPGIGLQSGDRRVYPEGSLASQLLGYVNSEDKGQYGLEQALDSQLAGKPGLLKTVTDVQGIPLSLDQNDVDVPAQNGKDVVLTIDRAVQAYAEQALKSGLDKAKAKHGSVLIMDPRTGSVLAMANLPTYDPSKYFDVTDYADFQNAVVSDPFEPGSVMKSLTMATGLNEGVITPDSTYNNTGSVKVDDTTIKNVLQVNGQRTMTDVLRYSLNTGAVYVFQQLGGGQFNKQGRDKIYQYFHGRFGFGELTGIEQAGESTGTVISPDEVQGNNVRYASMTFGQGMDNTMVQIVSAFSAAINGGNYYQPHLVDGYLNDDGSISKIQPEIVRSNVVTSDTSSRLRGMLHEARLSSFANIDKTPGCSVGGKTGTAQIINPETGKYEDSNAEGTYIGFGCGDQTQYVIMVRVVDAQIGGYAGSVAAAPIFADISNWLSQYLKTVDER